MSELVKREGGQLVLSEAAKKYVKGSRAKNTIRAYRGFWQEFEHWCASRGVPALPASEQSVIEYLTALADAGQKASTIDVKLAAIAWRHRLAKVADPTVYETVRAVMSGIRRELGTRPDKKEPAGLEDIQAMIGTLDTDTLKGKRDRALLLVGFAGAFRRSELVGLDVADLRFNGKLTITVRRSKTDQEGKGRIKTIPALEGNELCPVAALHDWLDTAGIQSGPVFRSITRWGKVQGRLTAQSVALVVKEAAKAAGLDWRSYSGHSLRSGFITEALNVGASDSDILEQTHQTESVMRDYRKSTGVGASRAVRAVFGEDSE